MCQLSRLDLNNNSMHQMLYFFHTLPRTQYQLFVSTLVQRSAYHNYSLHTQRVWNWLNSFATLLLALSVLYRRLGSLMTALEIQCLCLLEMFINVNKLLAGLLLPVYLFICFFYTAFCCCFLKPFFIMFLLLYFFYSLIM